MLLLPISVLLSATAEGFVELLYSSEFKMAGDAFRFLIFGFLFFSIFSVICTIITAIGHPGLSLGFALAMVPFNIIANIVLIPIYEIVGAAVATSLVFLVGLLFAGAYLFKRFGVFMDIKSFLRISIGSSVLYFVASRLDITGVELIAGYVCLAALYFILLILTKELNRDDLKIVKQTAGSLLNFKTLKCY